ncbi:MAG TPA: CRISPR-associated endonuclease Cas2 [Fimbriimonadaceae bacterium]|nr:CRISPR-associated endonuclease Cas2 [Fimbriimonadaceae bacterium]
MPVPEKIDILVCYDVKTIHSDGDRRLRQVAKACTQFGQRVQYSVFECTLTPANLQRMKQKLLAILDPQEDSLRIYTLVGPRGRCVETYGRDRWIDFDGPLIT